MASVSRKSVCFDKLLCGWGDGPWGTEGYGKCGNQEWPCFALYSYLDLHIKKRGPNPSRNLVITYRARERMKFVNTTAIAYGQKIGRSFMILAVCNSSCVHKRHAFASTVKTQIKEPRAMSLELPPLVRSGVFCFFYDSHAG